MWKRIGVTLVVLSFPAIGASASDTGMRLRSMLPQPTKPPHDLESVELHTALGSRIVQRARSVSLPNSEQTPYAHAIFHRIPSGAVYRDIIRVGKIRKVNGRVVRRAGMVYEQWTVNLLGQDINKVRERLAVKFPRLFYNLEPYVMDDKLTPKSKGLMPFDPAEIDSATGKILLWVWFHEDVPRATATKILNKHFENRDKRGAENNLILSDFGSVLRLAKMKEVQFLTEYEQATPVLNHTRSMIGLDREQRVDTTFPNPDPDWCNNHCAYSGSYYGRAVWVAVYDTGIDTTGDSTTMSDFRELDAHGKSRVRRANSEAWQNPHSSPPQHGSHVAGIIGGNGWNSSSSGGARYLWRGIAPKVSFISKSFSYGGWFGHVNNHSHIFGTGGYYNANDRAACA